MYNNKKAPRQIAAALPFCKLNSLYLVAFQTSRADVTGLRFTVLHIGNFLDVRLKRSSRLAVRMAHVVAGRSALPANTAYSRHIFTSER